MEDTYLLRMEIDLYFKLFKKPDMEFFRKEIRFLRKLEIFDKMSEEFLSGLVSSYKIRSF